MSKVVAKRYAKALYEVASEKQLAEAVGNELDQLVELLEASKEFSSFLQSPNVAPEAKETVIKEAFGGSISEPTYNVIRLLLDRNREMIIPDLFHAYVAIMNEATGKATAHVYSPYPLSNEDQVQVAASFSKLTGKQIEVENEVDPRLLGGIRVRIGDRLYDGSLAGKLNRLEKALNPTQAM